jgi:Ca-activated chloride channel homolog
MRHPRPGSLAVLLVSLAAVTSSAAAQGWIEPGSHPDRAPTVGAVVRESSEVRITIDGRSAGVEVEERFRNTGARVAEGSYLYPMPGEATFQSFSLWMGAEETKGEVMDAEQARGIYEEIVRRQRDPALLTFAGHGLVRARVFPIAPGETRRVALRYTQLLERVGAAVRLRYTLGNRDGGVTPALRVLVPSAAAYGAPYSPTHRLDVRREPGRLEIRLPGGADGDVEIFLPLAGRIAATSLVTHAPGGEDGYFMLLLSPPAVPDAGAIPRDLTFVVDVSGSMSGTKLEQAKAGLQQAFGTLSDADRFRVIAFSSGLRHFREGFVTATPAAVDDARKFVDRLGADGGTNIAGALEAALDGGEDAERLAVVVFLTDGLPSIGEQAPDRIAGAAAGRVGRRRLFTIGVGHDVNTYLLDRLAQEGRGSAEYVAPGASVERSISALLDKVRHPALVNLQIVSAPVELRLLQPARLPDLFYGEELVVFGRYRGAGSGDLVVEGERRGRRERFGAGVTFPRHSADAEFVPRLWAARRIGELTRQGRLEGVTASLTAEIREMGLRHGILTEYTSYLVQEPGQTASAPRPESRPPSQARNETGRAAFERAQSSSRLLAARTLDAEEDAAALRRTENAAIRRAGDRVFVARGGVWTDASHADSLHVTSVAAFSEAYFALTRTLPELAQYLTVGSEVLVAGRSGSIRIGSAGTTEWQAGELAELVRAFRGT